MFAYRHTIALETDASGDATGYSPQITGRITAIIYVKDDYAAGVDFTITAEATSETIWTESDVDASAVKYPRATVHGTDGVAGTAVEPILLANDRVKIVVAAGGNTKSGTFIVVTG